MDERALLQEMEQHLRMAPNNRVLYLEGKTDVPVFFALLGVAVPADGVHEGALVRGLRETSGAGGAAVRARVELASRKKYPGIVGIIDGDGRALAETAQAFDPPHGGPLYTWKAYCIENLLAKVGWPASWGASPEWTTALREFSAYVALNRLHLNVRQRLETLEIGRFQHPEAGRPLKTVEEVLVVLERDKHLIAGLDVAKEFLKVVTDFQTAVDESIDAAHAFLDGKWLLKVTAHRATGKSPEQCRKEWIESAVALGGLTEVRDLWDRLWK